MHNFKIGVWGGATGYSGHSARSVTRPQAGIGMSPASSRSGRSLVSLSQTCFGAGADHSNLATAGWSLALNRRTMIALPSSLGFRPLTSTSAGSICSRGVARGCAAARDGDQGLAEARGKA